MRLSGLLSVIAFAPAAFAAPCDTGSDGLAVEDPTIITDASTSSAAVTAASTSPDVADESVSEASQPLTNVAVAGAQGQINAVYYPNWARYQAQFFAKDIPADQVTHVLYAFGSITKDGTVVSSDPWADVGGDANTTPKDVANNIKDLYQLKKKNRQLKVLLSIGGWTYSQEGQFKSAVANEASRRRFATSAVQLMTDWGFDGIDIDWEYPANTAEAEQLRLLLQACRNEMNAYTARNNSRYHYLLTIASPASKAKYSVLNMRALDRLLDAWFLMAYDYAGTWESRSGHAANIYRDNNNPAATPYNTHDVVKDYIRAGVPARKIVLGMPLYGRGFANTGPRFGSPFNGGGPGSLEPGSYLYRDLPLSGGGRTSGTDTKVIGAWTYDSSSKLLISYDNPQTIKLKAQYIKNMGLGGAMFWDASGDKKGANDSLVRVAKSALGALDKSQNQLNYPKSRYQNIKNKSA